MTRIDAHQHFWRRSRGDYGWLTPEIAPLWRDFGPEDLAPHLETTGVQSTILVQAAPTVAETRYLLDIARRTDWVAGVVGWADFESRSASDEIAALAEETKLVGLRPMVQDIPDDDWLLRADLDPAFAAIAGRDLAYDALVRPKHLPRLLRRLSKHPELRAVVDHGAKPAIRDGGFRPWAGDIAQIARETSAYCKLSGLITEAAADWTVEGLRPYVDHLLDHFGTDRIIWGSDWPVATLATSYEEWHGAAVALTSTLTESARTAVFGGNAIEFYRLDRPGRLANPFTEIRGEVWPSTSIPAA